MLFRPIVDGRALRNVLTQGLEVRVFVLNGELVRSLDNDRDRYPPFGGTDDCILDVWNRVDRIAHQQDPVLSGVQNLEDRLFGSPQRDDTLVRAGPNHFDRLLFPAFFRYVGGRYKGCCDGLRSNLRDLGTPSVEEGNDRSPIIGRGDRNGNLPPQTGPL